MKEFEKLQNMSASEIALVIAKPIIILIVCKIIQVIVAKILDKVFVKSKLDLGLQGFLRQAIKIVIYVIGFIIAAQSLGIDMTSLVTVLGVVSLAFSLALQGILSNIFSGMVILITQPFVVGDFVEIAGVMGTVSGITLMRTKLNTPDNKVELIPNSDVASSRISNFSNQDKRRVDIEVSASYDDKTEHVLAALRSVIEADERILKDEEHLPLARLLRFGANDITYVIKVWCETAEYWNVYYDIMENVRKAYEERGITFSYPHTVVHIESDKRKEGYIEKEK